MNRETSHWRGRISPDIGELLLVAVTWQLTDQIAFSQSKKVAGKCANPQQDPSDVCAALADTPIGRDAADPERAHREAPYPEELIASKHGLRHRL